MSGMYNEEFYRGQDRNRMSAQAIVPLVLELVRPASVIDVGCGVATWLSVFREHGVREILGVDGDWVRNDRLCISSDDFLVADLTQPLHVDRQFDLVVCLEVAEHLSADNARTLVKSLTSLGSVVLFSAAIPFQGGIGHVNEQWPEYWTALFGEQDYVVIDCIRRRVWSNSRVVSHYAQNILLYVRRDHLQQAPALCHAAESTSSAQLSVVHPEFYLRYADPRNLTLDPERVDEYRSLSFLMVLPLLPGLARKALSKRVRRLYSWHASRSER